MRPAGILIAFLLAFLPPPAQAQAPAEPSSTPAGPSYVVFKFDWDQGRPWLNYTIRVEQSGLTHFEGLGNPEDSGDGDHLQQDFTMTPANRDKIFEFARKLDYFSGSYEAKQKNIAKTGQKTLEYHGLTASGKSVSHSSTYNFSTDPNVQDLTRLFQAIATTLSYGRKLTFLIRFDKLGIDAQLKSLQDMQSSHYVEELQAIEPILRKIMNDPNMMHISRITARQVLKTLGENGAQAATPSQP